MNFRRIELPNGETLSDQDFYGLAGLLNRLPEGREKSLALTKLHECFLWARESCE